MAKEKKMKKKGKSGNRQQCITNCYFNILLATNLIDLIKVLNVFFCFTLYWPVFKRLNYTIQKQQQTVSVSKLDDAMDKNEYDQKSIKITLTIGREM